MKLYIGENLKKLRAEKNVTQDTLAEYLGVTYQAVSRWENEIAYPDIELLPEIARFFEVSLEELMGLQSAEREARSKASVFFNSRYQNKEEALRNLRELERQYPNNWEIKELICCMLIEPKPDSYDEVLPELRRYARAMLERFRTFEDEEARVFLWFCRTMTIAAAEEEVDEWAERLPRDVDLANQRDNVMKIRYQEREDWEKARHYESRQILCYLHELIRRGPIPEVMQDTPKGGIFVNHYIERIYDAVLGTPYSENGAVHNSIYLYERADNYFSLAFCHIGSWSYRGTEQEVEDGLAALEKAVDYTLLYGDALKEDYFVCDNPYLEPQPVSKHMNINVAYKNKYMREKAVDWAIEKMTGNSYHTDVQGGAHFQAQLQRLYNKKAELEEYWKTHA